jgi:hypothetical protein
MSLLMPSETSARRALDHLRFDLLTTSLMERYSPSILYCAMLFWVRRQGKKDGTAHWWLRELFGHKTRYKKGDPIHLDDPEFEEWMDKQGRRSKRAWLNKKARERKERKGERENAG